MFDMTPITVPVFGVFNEVTRNQPDIGINRGKHTNHPAARGGDPLLIGLWKMIKLKRVLQPFLQAVDGLRESLLLLFAKKSGHPLGVPFIRLHPDLFQSLGEVEESSFSVKQTLLEIGVSRSTFYEWYKRCQEHGYEGLRSHHKSPRQIWNNIPGWEKQRVLDVA